MPSQTTRPTAIVYIDGMNLYHRMLRRDPKLKWLDLQKFCDINLPQFEITRIHYYTALVSSAVTDALGPTRQKTYLRAIEAINPIVKIHLGRMKVETVITRIGSDRRWPFRATKPKKVKKATEKESDVALATQMVHDAHTTNIKNLIIVTNDTDFAPAVRIIQENTSVVVGILCPGRKPAGSLLLTNPVFVKILDFPCLYESQLPDTVKDKHGHIKRPPAWT